MPKIVIFEKGIFDIEQVIRWWLLYDISKQIC